MSDKINYSENRYIEHFHCPPLDVQCKQVSLYKFDIVILERSWNDLTHNAQAYA